MRIKIGAVPFDIDPQHTWPHSSPDETRQGREMAEEMLAKWDCREQKWALSRKLDDKGRLSLKPFVAFSEPRVRPILTAPDPTETLKMKMKTLAAIPFRSVDDLTTAIGRVVGTHKIQINTATYDWLKPFAGFEVWMTIEYHYFELTNALRGLRFLIGIPHQVRLQAKVDYMCDPEGLAKAIAGGKKLDEVDLGLTGPGTKAARALRRAVLRERIRDLTMPPLDSTLGGGFAPDYLDGFTTPWKPSEEEMAAAKELEEDLKQLETMEGEEGED